MGYYITLTNEDFVVPETQEVLDALRAVNTTFDDYKNGGSSNGERWFSWMPPDYDKTVTTARDVFELLGFETSDEPGGFRLVGYDNKAGQEDLFLAVVAPFVEEGSFIEWRGEDASPWRHQVQDGKLMVLDAVVQYTNPSPYRLCTYTMSKSGTPGRWIICDPYSDVAPHAQFQAQHDGTEVA